MNRNKTDAALQEYVQTALRTLGPENRKLVDRLLVRRVNKDRQWTTNYVWALSWARIDAACDHRDITTLTADEWAGVVTRLRQEYAASSLTTTVSYLRAGLRSALGLRELPMDIDDSLCVNAPEPHQKARVVTDDEFRMLLEHVAYHEAKFHSPTHVAMKLALLWTFWDSGLRCDELRVLNWGDLDWQSAGGAMLRLPSRAEFKRRGCRLKTVPREVYVVECVGPLKAWQALHPHGADPAAPIFLAFTDSSGSERLSKKVLNQWVSALGQKAGLCPVESRRSTQVLRPHDFRHTRITRMARSPELNFMQFSMYFWGIPDSKEARTYVHLRGEDLRTMVRQNLGLDDLGYLQHVDAGDDAAALASILDRLLRKAKAQPTVRSSDQPSR